MVFTSDTSTSITAQLFHHENGLYVSISASTNTRIYNFPFLVLALVLAFALCRVKTKHCVSTRRFTTSGHNWPIKVLVPDSPTSEHFEQNGRGHS